MALTFWISTKPIQLTCRARHWVATTKVKGTHINKT